jgi:hypothetical protein
MITSLFITIEIKSIRIHNPLAVLKKLGQHPFKDSAEKAFN